MIKFVKLSSNLGHNSRLSNEILSVCLLVYKEKKKVVENVIKIIIKQSNLLYSTLKFFGQLVIYNNIKKSFRCNEHSPH